MIAYALLLLLLLDELPQSPVLVDNGPEPENGHITLKLTEELRIGPHRGDEHTLWTGVNVSVDVDPQGNIYVADGDQCRILVFDGKGGFIRQIGRCGDGPGEFRALRRFQILDDGRGVAFEKRQAYARFDWFDSEGRYLTARRFETANLRFREVIFAPDGKTYACDQVRIDSERHMLVTRLKLMNTEDQVLREFARLEEPEFDGSHHRDRAYWITYLAGSFTRVMSGQSGHYAFDRQSRVYAGMGHTYQITRYRPDGAIDLVVQRQYRPSLVREEEKQHAVNEVHENLMGDLPSSYRDIVTREVVARAFDEAEIPAAAPPVNGLIPMEQGFIVIHRVDTVEDRARCDLFDETGHFLGQFEHGLFGLKRMVFRGGKVYTIERNADDENEMVRYKASLVSTP